MKKTIENLTKAFIGESQARNKYTLYANIARKEGFEKIAATFQETADQEFEHAEWHLKMLNGLKTKEKWDGRVEVPAASHTFIGTTLENLKEAMAGETYETSTMYPGFADAAEKEGYKDIADRLRRIANAEAHHRDRYSAIIKEIEAGTLFKKKEKVEWACRKCGYVHTGNEPPEKCPLCGHEHGFYELRCECF